MTRLTRLLVPFVLVALTPAVSAEPDVEIGVSARRLVQGELIVMTMAFADDPASVRVRVFSREIPAFKVASGRWRALIGIDLDQQPALYTAVVEASRNGTVDRRSHVLRIGPAKFATRTLRVDPEFVNPPPAQMDRITTESRFLRETYAHSAAERLWSESFVRPVSDPANSRFGTRSVFNGERRSPHGGADFLSPAGTPIKAPNAGRVVCARDLFFTGNTVIIDHGMNAFSMLAHLSRIDVKEGETVTPGQTVGLVGATGRVTGPHLHWAFTVNGARVDPLSLLALVGPGRAQ